MLPSMPFIEGVGDELVYAVIFAAPVVFISRHYIRNTLDVLKGGAYIVQKWLGSAWNLIGHHLFSTEITTSAATSGGGEPMPHMNAPHENDCCSICHDTFILPCQANCAHWFCGECILRVWQHSSALQPCKCPICRRPITLLIPSDSVEQQTVVDSDRIMRDIAKYNRFFGGGPVSFLQRVQDMPLLLRRMVSELLDPQRALFLVHRTRIVLCLVLLMCYILSPLDILPESILGIIGLLDDLFVALIVLFYVAMLYRSTLLLQHGGHV
ncbi:hypothetical protein O6H91_19G027200 [Diphasiastrum complanatum]|uniref:Uncharacterized protein n=2 Tax=Diphasiastrum complanatum TaxID=34168 RepID=A0ACC2ATS9_DIPCM|nr:hypothetical protein O6H91_19G027200 [Diphasiastrum complanatum]KAJ7520876.1 hypothetical protein O6H91_19G027200 [Diphasiastrum complanatum]